MEDKRLVRRSDPTPPARLASPKPARGGWEYPLSREEKKQRVICLYQAELASAEKSKAKSSESQAAYTSVSSSALKVETPAGGRTSNTHFVLYVLLAIVVFLAAVALRRPQSPNEAEATIANLTTPKLHGETGSDVPPNITDRVLALQLQGHARLKISNCAEAAWWFSSALDLLGGDAAFAARRAELLGEWGFALVCGLRFQEGATTLEQHLQRVGFDWGAPHLLNALGYAYFFLEEYQKAGEAFEFAIRRDRDNPLLWNNYAAVQMAFGNFEVADNALNQGMDNLKTIDLHREHQTNLIVTNIQILQDIVNEQQTVMPQVDLWNGYLED